jgi:ATP-dependent phosphoenolpyruvate carboxykinase
LLSQIPNPSVAALYEDALVYETGTAITSSGALTAYSGAKTGRSPLDKRIVQEDSSKDDIWYVISRDSAIEFQVPGTNRDELAANMESPGGAPSTSP